MKNYYGVHATWLKFAQNKQLLKWLMQTNNRYIVVMNTNRRNYVCEYTFVRLDRLERDHYNVKGFKKKRKTYMG